jgi:cytochrome P450
MNGHRFLSASHHKSRLQQSAVTHADKGPQRKWSLAILGAQVSLTPSEVVERGNNALVSSPTTSPIIIDDLRKNTKQYADNVIGRLIESSFNGYKLNNVELVQICIFILNARYQPPTNLIGNGITVLFDNPEHSLNYEWNRI